MSDPDMEDDFFDASDADLFRGLNPQQAEAVTAIEGPLMILAGPGSGKTRVITHRIAYMIQQGIPAERILALTFTNKAADELNQRIGRLVPGRFVWAGTFHRFCSRLLRQYASLVGLNENFSILDMDDSKKVLSAAWDQAEIDDAFVSLAAVHNEISRAKNALVTAEDYQARPGVPLGKVVQTVFPLYQRKLLECNSVDFDDLLVWTATILRDHPELRESLDQRFAFIMVDEYQDTNLAQYAIVRSLSNVEPHLAVTGDPDQSIYGWRGANLGNILGFERDFPQVRTVRLEQNYRSTQSILKAADRLIANNRRRKAKSLVPTHGIGTPVQVRAFPSPQDEAGYIVGEIQSLLQNGIWEPRDIAIFYRANWLSRYFEHECQSVGVPFQLVNGFEFYQRKEIKDLIAYLRLVDNPKNDVALERIINAPARKIGKVTLDRLRTLAQQRRISLLEACRLASTESQRLGRSAAAVARFVAQMDQITAAPVDSVKALLQVVLEVTGYRRMLEMEVSEVANERLGNVDELLVAVQEFDRQNPDGGGLGAYLETAALVSDTDKYERDANRVKMMTMHAAKGLEFSCVYIVGVEEGILPHERSMKDDLQLEEERRLMFVGITRAQQQLTISRCEGRMRRGQFTMSPASRFVMELIGEGVEYLRSSPRHSYSGDSLGIKYSDLDNHSTAADDFDAVQQEPDEAGDWIADQCGGEAFEVGAETGPTTGRKSGNGALPQVTTAAALLASQDSARTGENSAAATEGESPNQPGANYRPGTMVEHPEYGPGKVLSVSGPHLKQMVSVHFFSVGEKKFRAKFCPLKPLA